MQPKNKQPKTKKSKLPAIVIIVAILLVLGIGGFACYNLLFAAKDQETDSPAQGSNAPSAEPIYSTFTGLEISDASLNTSPTFCIQIPNGSTDGARPQAGLAEAGVVFEAIAESGITRFAAIFQNPTSSTIGPVRSLRPYYLDWDTPFNCTVTHAGGSDEALAAIARGGQRNLDESNTYMWRENGTGRSWNNLFTSPADLLAFNTSKGYNTSNPQNFPRLTPAEAAAIASNNLNPATCAEDMDCVTAEQATLATRLNIKFGNLVNYNTVYTYSPETNTYLRSYQSGDAHLVYQCPAGLTRPITKTECGNLVQITPSAVVAMMVQESTMADHYHENINTISSGTAYIFQNGAVVKGTWSKTSQSSQILFKDSAGEVIRFAPGQLWIAAVPQFGSVSWE